MPYLAAQLRRATSHGYRVTIAPALGPVGRPGGTTVDVVGDLPGGPHSRQLVDANDLDLDADSALALAVTRGTAAVSRAIDDS